MPHSYDHLHSDPKLAKVISKVLDAVDNKLYSALEELAGEIETAREEISHICPNDINEHHIPTATDELDAIVGATEEATGQILDSCEALSTICEDLPDGPKQAVNDEVMKMFEACNFQDITGQRITRVIKTLQQIEDRIERILDTFGSEIERRVKPPELVPGDVCQGPVTGDEGIDQTEVDDLLASFD